MILNMQQVAYDVHELSTYAYRVKHGSTHLFMDSH
jgi:hypothetical protein